ncbi:MAG: S58 family peptidase [Acidobacteria bacterium]|nr:MAG: S58 family peptidase [Acidobacteriota bacterium]REK02470.1 MAG: S58 family peptidase [Acidobacteriota bacterium]REK13728.1 MAG: S58 family peptidase [Acidobacteriota bacterium]REK41722.1 MAG: S58 family peptidase [Acidobacteriota bacterium]
MTTRTLILLALIFLAGILIERNTYNADATTTPDRMRAREAGLSPGVMPTGSLNAITDVEGVKVGHTTIIKGENVRTGVTAVLPHGGNLFAEKVPAAVFIGNGFGKFIGTTQIKELGEIETPVLLTSTLAVPKVGDFLISHMLALKGNEDVRSINPVVAETNDAFLNDIRGRHFTQEDVSNAINSAKHGAVDEGSVGAGTGTVAFGFKGGIGTSSRKIPENLGGYTVGVLVQSNFGGVLTIDGAPVGEELGRYYMKGALEGSLDTGREDLNELADGSIIIVVATDAPLSARNLERLAARTMMGLARTGASGSNGSGDYAIAFSTADSVRRTGARGEKSIELLGNDSMSPLFLAVIEATEEAIYNSLFMASSVSGNGRTVEALPIDRTVEILKKYKRVSSER